MIRGRRVFVWFLIFFMATLLFARSANAIQLGMSAYVPLSPLWQSAIEENTATVLDTKTHRNIAELSVQIRGINMLTLPKQTVQAILFSDDVLADNQIALTNDKGYAKFTFVYKLGGNYRIVLLNTTYQYPFVIKTIGF